MNKLFFAIILYSLTFGLFAQNKSYEVLLNGNAYVTVFPEGAKITSKGLEKWIDKNAEIKTYIYFNKPQTVQLEIKGIADQASTIEVEFAGKKKKIKLQKGNFSKSVGKFKISDAGYHFVKLKGIKKTADTFAHVSSFLLQSDDELTFVNNFSEYWGRRGPSVHLKYEMPQNEEIEWFYNEITVPENNDVIGSYYMANGFGQGYFGIQCNSETERRVLFSVWSPFDTQDPKLIPDSLKIKMLRKGEGVHIGEFGNEGSGGQSFLRYNWKAGNTYQFLTQIKPDGEGNTIYTAYFFATDENRWRLIASFLRPQTDTHYTGAHSFLENFIPEQGYITRKVLFTNQWFQTTKGKWVEATNATFTYDETARKKARLDYQGGNEKDAFYLQNCGFFNESTTYNSKFSRPKNNQPPQIDFEALKDLNVYPQLFLKNLAGK